MRVFVAIEISENHIINSIKEFQKKINVNAKPVEAKNFHFTLQFLGGISEQAMHRIIQALIQLNFQVLV